VSRIQLPRLILSVVVTLLMVAAAACAAATPPTPTLAPTATTVPQPTAPPNPTSTIAPTIAPTKPVSTVAPTTAPTKPAAAATTAPPPTVAATGATGDVKLEVASYNAYVTQSQPDILQVVGEVVNKGKGPVDSITIEASAISDSGAVLLASNANIAKLRVLPDGGKYPFFIQLKIGQGVKYKEVKFKLDGKPNKADPRDHLQLKAIDVAEVKLSGATAPVKGKISNEGTAEASSVVVIAVAYDAGDKVLDVGFGQVYNPIPSKGTGTFELSFYGLKAAPVKTVVMAQGAAKQ
jgi:hypothetical protein